MKRILTILLSLLLIIGSLPMVTVSAEEGTVYYVSASGGGNGLSESAPMSLSSLNSKTLTGGTKVLFKCGDTFYGNVAPKTFSTTEENIIELGTYGSGAMPIFSGAKIINKTWIATEDGFFKYDLTDISGFDGLKTTYTNIGFIENSAGIKYGVRCLNAEACANEYDFYCDEQFIYIKTANEPYASLGELKLACGISVFSLSSNMEIHDLHIRDAGYGVVWKTKSESTTKNVKISNCVFDNLGGHYIGGLNSGIKGGNAIEFADYASDCIIENNIIRNCYDVGFTCQGSGEWSNVSVNNNIFAYNTQSFEIWCTTDTPDDAGVIGLGFENNVCIAQGQGWGYETRTNKRVAADILTYRYEATEWDMTVNNNLFYHSNSNGSIYYSSLYSKNMMISDITPNNNAIYMPSNSLAIFRDDNNDILFSDWQSLGCDTQSNLNIINNLEKYRVMEQLALYSYDFNEILAEIKNVGLTTNAVYLTRDTAIVPGRAEYAVVDEEKNILLNNQAITITPHHIETDGLDWTKSDFSYQGKTLSDGYLINGSYASLTDGNHTNLTQIDSSKTVLDAMGIVTRRLAIKIDLGEYYKVSSIKIDTQNGTWAAGRMVYSYNVYGSAKYDENTILNDENLIGSFLVDANNYWSDNPRETVLENKPIKYVLIVFNLLGTDPGMKDNPIFTDLTGVPVKSATSYIFAGLNNTSSYEVNHGGRPFLSEIEIIGFADYDYEEVTLIGDVDGNNVINVCDLVRFKKYFALLDVKVVADNLDVNKDGIVSGLDLTALRQNLLNIV